MALLVNDHVWQAQTREASPLASEAMALIESTGDPTLTVGLSWPLVYAKMECGEWTDVLRWSQRVIDLADGDPSKGNFVFGCPLALAFATRAIARYCLGHSGWRNDLRHGLTMARNTDPISYVALVTYTYGLGIFFGVVSPDDHALREADNALRIAERSGDDLAFVWARMTLGLALVHRDTAGERERGTELLTAVSEDLRRRGHNLGDLPLVEVYSVHENARRVDRDDTIPIMRTALEQLIRGGQVLSWGIPATGVLAETLLDRGGKNDVTEAETVIERLAAAPSEDGVALRDIWLLRLRALLAQARGDEPTYRDYRDRYRAMATLLGFEGHIAWAEAMP